VKIDNVADTEKMNTEVAALLADKQLQKSRALSDLLKFLCLRYPHKTEEPTTEYLIAQDLLKRGASFDPKEDPVVRVRVRRLREVLKLYYSERSAGIILTIPSRSYDLDISEIAPVNKKTKRRPILLTILGVISLLLTWVIWPKTSPQSTGYPIVKVLPVQNMTGDPTKNIFEGGFQRQIASDLQHFGQLKAFISNSEDDAGTAWDFELRGSLLAMGDEIDMTFSLEKSNRSGIVYDIRVHDRILGKGYYKAMSAISAEISGKLASQGGPLSSGTMQSDFGMQGLGPLGGIHQNTFACMILHDTFFEDYNVDTFISAYRCFEGVLPEINDDPSALSDWGTLVLHAVPEFKLMTTGQLPANMIHEGEAALIMAQTIVERFPHSSEAFLLLGATQMAKSQLPEAAISLQHAIRLNPSDATAYSVFAYLQLSLGHFQASIDATNTALSLSAYPQGHVFLPAFIAALALNEKTKVVAFGEQYAGHRSGDSAVIAKLIVAQSKNDALEVARLLPIVKKMQNPIESFSAIGVPTSLPYEVLRDALSKLECCN
jgi:hypothetical protein